MDHTIYTNGKMLRLGKSCLGAPRHSSGGNEDESPHNVSGRGLATAAAVSPINPPAQVISSEESSNDDEFDDEDDMPRNPLIRSSEAEAGVLSDSTPIQISSDDSSSDYEEEEDDDYEPPHVSRTRMRRIQAGVLPGSLPAPTINSEDGDSDEDDDDEPPRNLFVRDRSVQAGVLRGSTSIPNINGVRRATKATQREAGKVVHFADDDKAEATAGAYDGVPADYGAERAALLATFNPMDAKIYEQIVAPDHKIVVDPDVTCSMRVDLHNALAESLGLPKKFLTVEEAEEENRHLERMMRGHLDHAVSQQQRISRLMHENEQLTDEIEELKADGKKVKGRKAAKATRVERDQLKAFEDENERLKTLKRSVLACSTLEQNLKKQFGVVEETEAALLVCGDEDDKEQIEGDLAEQKKQKKAMISEYRRLRATTFELAKNDR